VFLFNTSDWPFLHPLVQPIPVDCHEIRVANLHDAFVNHQTANTRLVTTNPSYLMQVWLHAIGDRPDVRIVASANREALAEHAPEALARRGPFASPKLELHLEPPTAPHPPGTPGAPNAPHAPGAPAAHGAPSAPGAPHAPGAPGAPNAPHAPGAPGAPNAPHAPGARGAPNAPHAPGAPNAPDAPDAPAAHGAPNAPHAPGARGAPNAPHAPGARGAPGVLARAFRTRDPQERLALCIQALDEERSAPALLAAASTCMEVNDLDAAARDLEDALALAPDWAAAHFEHGKLWLRRDDMERAAEAFRHAAHHLPIFTAAWANLGATLGELDRPQEALVAFETALSQDPENPQALNNVGVVRRELGRLDDSVAAFRRVTELVPERAFGYYNLGHTLFLQGRYQAALSAYIEGQRRDAERNAVQATRLALCRLATGDAAAALADLRQATAPLTREHKHQLLADTQAVAWALLTHRPDIPGWNDVNRWIGAELAKLT
jgi:tetratricopeptide (TPR) repeat protein